MSKIVRGVSFPNDDINRRFGYVAVFADGDIRKHATGFPKTHCVRVRLKDHKRWQECPLNGTEVRDGLQLHDFGPYTRFFYEWFTSEHEACRVVKKALALTQLIHYRGVGVPGDGVHPLNEPWVNDPYYESVCIAPARAVWEKSDTIDDLKKLEDPRLTICDESALESAFRALGWERKP